MQLSHQLTKHLRDVHFGGNWTTSNLKDTLAGVNWQMATTQVHGLNTIMTLVYHTHYYIAAVTKVLQGEPLNAKDAYSFDHPLLNSEEEWQQFLDGVWTAANTFADLIEQMPDEKVWSVMENEKYGTWYRNIQGIIEHTHYHLGQIAIIKKMLLSINN